MTAPRKQCHVHLYRQVTLDHPDESKMHQIRWTCRTPVLQSVNEHFKHPPVKEDHFDIFGRNVAMI
nr:unnamed protein product [Callosobruchus analis]